MRAANKRQVDRNDDADLVPGCAKARDEACERRPHIRVVVEELERQGQLVLGLPDGETFVADCTERPPCPCGESLSIQFGQRLRRAETATRPADEQDPG